MSRKSKRRSARARARPQAPVAQTASVASAAQARPQARVGGDQALVRSIEMSLGTRQPVRKAGRQVTEQVDPAIPLNRVPFFVSDLRKLGIVAGLMIVLLVAGSRLIPLVVK